ncbi:thiolase family protein [Agrococcus jejuensis]|uniref:Acetyl-CoA acyltransferase n=1 Tax=Agrococcus jejuensis TaxID=399736 RepID=A0A1G8B896_9MICO|nr:thiolase family protein [Agrococcus jejuensis]SDH29361.1 acetyl-CoA acyltransferase [Agrococcus jejuensis]
MSAVIVDVLRTASGRGKPGGALSAWHPAALLGTVIAELVDRAGIDPALVDDVYAGCVSQVGQQTQNVARTAALAAGLPVTVPGTTIDRQCGSSQQAIHFAHAAIASGLADCVIACGVELMSTHPIGSAAIGHDPIPGQVHGRFPGLTHQGVAAELVAARFGIGRDAQDEYAARSHARAAAVDWGDEILTVAGIDGVHGVDETIRAGTTVERLATLQPAFRTDALAAQHPGLDWAVTAGNASPLTDGASAVLVTSEAFAAAHGLTPRVRIVDSVAVGSDPVEMLSGVIPATERILDRQRMRIDDVDLVEVNEAFASIPLAWLAAIGGDGDRLNARGGAIALGHALGSSGTRIMTTLVHGLERSGTRYGLQTMCEGGGMANATLVERL